MVLEFVPTTQFRRDAKLARKRNWDMSRLQEVVDALLEGQPLPERCRDHGLSGPYVGKRECHIAPDWPFVYAVADGKLIADRTGTHADLFGL